MKDLLVGSTGFVGGNLSRAHGFSALCHRSDIKSYYCSAPDLCVYAGVPASMVTANANPEADLALMSEARENLRKINPAQVVLISTIAVYKDSRGKNEDSAMDAQELSAYGKNRLLLEEWVREDFPRAIVIRLPALYGFGIKKNFLFDIHTITPSMLSRGKFDELKGQSELVESSYTLRENGFFCLNADANTRALREFFVNNEFNALSFTDSRSVFQFYGLSRLWADISLALENNIEILNLCTPPVSAKRVYEHLIGSTWDNILSREPFSYDLRSKHSRLLGGDEKYLCSASRELDDIANFMESWRD